MDYLFWSQTVVWGFILGYLVVLIKKTKKLSKELDIIKSRLDNKDN